MTLYSIEQSTRMGSFLKSCVQFFLIAFDHDIINMFEWL